MNVVALLQKMISIPSFVDEKNNENRMGDFVYDFLRNNKKLRVTKQKIAPGRYNIFVRTAGQPRLFFAGHLDTVQPKQGWQTNQFIGQIKGDKLFGLGANDTKGGVAALLISLVENKNISGVTALFYCDEEYDFLGMRHFLQHRQQSKRRLVGRAAVVIERTNLKLLRAHRGLIELRLAVRGKSGHASRPDSGVNAIDILHAALRDLRVWLKKQKSPELGFTVMNVAAMRGGLYRGVSIDQRVFVGEQGNNIADYAEAVIDIRPANQTLDATTVIKFLQARIKKLNGQMLTIKIKHDLGAMLTSRTGLTEIEKTYKRCLGNVAYMNPLEMGYGDGQLLAKRFPDLAVCYLGPIGANSHAANEWVSVSSLRVLQRIYTTLIHESTIRQKK